jgi:N-acetylglucosaminyldiphosphoundecaprenol N-acetyl-beta-D-mannosaminyltransferase
MPVKASIAKLALDVLSYPALIQRLSEALKHSESYYISTCTAYNFALAHEDERVFTALMNADLLVADGMPLVWIQRQLGFRDAERMYGPDILWSVCEATAHQPVQHYFYGGRSTIAQRLADRLTTALPELSVCGYAAAPDLPERDIVPDEQTVAMLNQAQADIIWIGLGAPRQDVWMYAYRPLLNAPILIGVGAAFDFLSGNKRQAPRLLQNNGLEWLFRLVHEPRRLGRRYLIYNLRFIIIILRWALSERQNRK